MTDRSGRLPSPMNGGCCSGMARSSWLGVGALARATAAAPPMDAAARRAGDRRRRGAAGEEAGDRLADRLPGRALVEDEARRGVGLEEVIAAVGSEPQVDA